MARFALLTLASLTLLAFAPHASAQNESAPVFANEQDKANFLTLDAVEVQEIATPNFTRPLKLDGISPRAALPFNPGDIINIITNPASPEAWVTLGLKAWDIIVANQPVANVSTQRVSILPQSQMDWTKMANWQGPATKTYSLVFKNLYGMEVIKHVYTIAYNYGGTYNGKGSYLANATLIPTQVSVTWGFNLDSKVEVGQTVNMGPEDSPVPGVEMQLQWKVKTIFKDDQGVNSFFLKGNGETVFMNEQK